MKLTPRQERILQLTFIDYQQTSDFLKYPLIIDRAEGLYYWNEAGKRFFDAIGGIFVANLGHRHPSVIEAMHKQMEKITFAPSLHGTTNVTLDFIELLGTVTPDNLNYIKPFSGGSESVEAAMKFVRQYFKQTGQPGKYKFISFYQGYHGATFGAMAASGTGPRKSKFEPQMGGFIKALSPMHYREHFSSWDEANRFAARMVEKMIIFEDPDTIAGIIIEPICNTGGIITPTDEFFSILRDICTRHGVILIYDEVITGYARTGNMFAAQTFGSIPDIICSGKGLSSGAIPLGAMMVREDLKTAFYGPLHDDIHFAHGHTFAGNPLACAAGLAVIKEIVDNKLDQKARVLGEYLVEKLQGLKRFGVIREVRGKGLIQGVELVKDTAAMEPYPELGNALKRTSLDNGIIFRINPTWFAVAPALIAEKEDIDEMVALIEKSLEDALAEISG